MPNCDKDGHTVVIDKGVIPTCQNNGLSQGAHCSVCGTVIKQQYLIKGLHDFHPTSKTNGAITYTCTGCNYDYVYEYTSIPTEQEVYNAMIAMKKTRPEGMHYDNDTIYISSTVFHGVNYNGGGCVAFAFELSDAAFGGFPGRIHFDFAKIRVGDIIRLNNNAHSVIVLKVEGDTVTIAEANYNSSVHWGRTLKLSDAEKDWNYIITRYPE